MTQKWGESMKIKIKLPTLTEEEIGKLSKLDQLFYRFMSEKNLELKARSSGAHNEIGKSKI
jgi:hypothetical protein